MYSGIEVQIEVSEKMIELQTNSVLGLGVLSWIRLHDSVY